MLGVVSELGVGSQLMVVRCADYSERGVASETAIMVYAGVTSR